MIDLLRFFLFKRFLKRNDLWPQNIQIGRLGRFFVVTCYDTSNSQAYIQRSACTGMSPHPLIANMKALSEWLERKVIQSQSTKDNPWSLFGSEGCAAMPTFLRLNSSSEHMAQERSICEAIERFVWTAWWTLSSKADVCLASEDSIFTEMNNEFKNIKISKIHLIKPSFISTQNLEDRYEVLILFAQLQKGGFISGGACGPIDKKNEIFERAYAELFRHSLAFDRHQSQKLEPTNDYDRRLIYFGSGQGNDLVMERLTDSIDATKKPVQVPNTWVRRFIAHPYATSFKVHQCLFENQQPFIDSRMDILCL